MRRALVLMVVSVLVSAGCGGDDKDKETTARSTTPSSAPGEQVTVLMDGRTDAYDAGTFDGTGYKNSGLLGSIPPAIVSYKLTFTKPGTYSYVCLLHPAMGGSVKVT